MASFSPVLEETIHNALTFASDRRHELATLEHLLLALVDDKDAAAVMTAFEEARPTAGFHRVIQRAVIHVQSSGREEVTGANALVALFAERESHAVYFLSERDMTRYDAVNYISHGLAKNGESKAVPVRGTEEPDAGGDEKKKSAAIRRTRLKRQLSILWTWARCLPGPAIAVISKSASRLS